MALFRSGFRLQPKTYVVGGCWEIQHPPVHEHEKQWKKIAPLFRANLSSKGRFIPKNFALQQQNEALRHGEYLGPDWPYNLLGMPMWCKRRYNVSYNPLPDDQSREIGVQFANKRNHWIVEWKEQGKHRIRGFRAMYGHKQTKATAECFRRMLEATGRIDNCRTSRQATDLWQAGKEARNARRFHFRKQILRRSMGAGKRRKGCGPSMRQAHEFHGAGEPRTCRWE